MAGTQVSAGATILKNAGFKVEVQRVTDPAKKDRVLRQDPQAGDKVDKGSTVTLQVSDGPGQALIPVVQDFPRKQAEKRLRDAGFRVQARSEASDTIAKGHATRTSPSEGQEIEKDSLVTLFISSGAAQVTVPDVTGQTQSAAEAEISGRGLKVEVSEEDSDTKDPWDRAAPDARRRRQGRQGLDRPHRGRAPAEGRQRARRDRAGPGLGLGDALRCWADCGGAQGSPWTPRPRTASW